jgi:hypothetical protein
VFVESGRWIDGRYEPFEPPVDPWADDADAPTDLPEQGSPALSWAGSDAQHGEDAGHGELAVADPAGAGAVAAWAEGSGDTPPPSPAALRAVAAVAVPLAALLVTAGVVVLVREGPTAVANAGGPLASAQPTSDASTDLPPMPTFGPLERPEFPVAPPADESVADVPVQSERAARTSVAAARRILATQQAPTSSRAAPSTSTAPSAPAQPPPSSTVPVPTEPTVTVPTDPGTGGTDPGTGTGTDPGTGGTDPGTGTDAGTGTDVGGTP